MKALSIRQPYASLVAIGAKSIETRSWSISYRGWLAIHASASFPRGERDLCRAEPFRPTLLCGGYQEPTDLPRGAIVAVANLHRVGEILRRPDGAVMVRGRELPVVGDELAFGDYAPGRYGWILTDVWPLEQPIPCKGALNLWRVPPEVVAQLPPRWREVLD